MAGTYGDISPRSGIALGMKALSHAAPLICVQQFGQKHPIPANKGQVLKMRRALPFALATTALTEGVKPSEQQLVYSDVTFTLAQYGAFARFTDRISDTHEDPVLSDLSMLSGEQAAETIEKVVIGNIIGGSNAVFANGSARGSVNSKLTLNVQRKATKALKAAKAKKITKILSPSVMIGTKPVEASFIAFAHTDLEPDIRGLTGFKTVSEYGSMKPTCAEEIGACEDVRYILTTNMTPWIDAGGAHGGLVVSTGGTSADVYPVIYIGEEAFGCTALKGKEGIEMMVLKSGVPRAGDELGMWGSVGWKTYHASGILNGAWLVRAEVAQTLLT